MSGQDAKIQRKILLLLIYVIPTTVHRLGVLANLCLVPECRVLHLDI